MKQLLQLIIAATGIAATAIAADEKPSTVRVDHDPMTIAEFERLVRDAAAKGAICVRFPSGEWHWHCSGHIELPKKDNFSEWSSSDRAVKREELEQWLTMNEVVAVQILMSQDIAPSTYFEIESILRSRKIYYWVVSSDPLRNEKKKIRILETDGMTMVKSKADKQ